MILFAAGGGGLGQDADDEDCAAELFVTDMTADTRALMLRRWACHVLARRDRYIGEFSAGGIERGACLLHRKPPEIITRPRDEALDLPIIQSPLLGV